MSDILSKLYNEYVVTGNIPGSSSHWKEYSSQFVFELDDDGVPVMMRGFGFGDVEAKEGLWNLRSRTMVTPARRLLRRKLAQELLSLVRTIVSPFALKNWGLVRAGKNVTHAMGLAYAQDAWRQAMTLALLKDHGVIPEPPGVVMVIGDGYGLLSGLIHRVYPGVRVVTVDLGPTLCFQVSGLQRAFPDARHVLINDEADALDWDFLYVPAERINEIPDSPLSLSVNVASMQEMTPKTVAAYFAFMRNRGVRHFYCCNREKKVLVGGEVSAFKDYPWSREDVHLVDAVCPWHRYSLDYGIRKKGPYILGLGVPFVNHFNVVRHRLTRMASSHT